MNMRYIMMLFPVLLLGQTPAVTVGVDSGLKCDVTSGNPVLANCTAPVQYIDSATAVRISGETAVRPVASVSGNAITLNNPPALSATQVTIYKVVDAIDHGALRVFMTTSPAAYEAVSFGTSSGSYSYRTYQGYVASTLARISVGGLNPGTTYYFRINANPNYGSPANGCSTDACGSTEFSITTPPVVGVHPTLPSPPNAWIPPTINTSGYTVFPVPAFPDGTITGSITNGSNALTVNSTAGIAAHHWIKIAGASCNQLGFPPLPDCQIQSITGNTVILTSNVSGTATNAPVTWSIYTISDFMYSSLPYHFNYGTLIQFAQGYRAKWFAQNQGNGSNGIELGPLPADNNCGGPCALSDPRHRWIVFDTAPGPGFIPPLGVRADPSTSANLGGLVLESPGTNAGDLFVLDSSSATMPPHHFAIRRLALTAEVSLGNGTDPQDAQGLIGPTYSGNTTSATLPQYVIVDGIYMYSPAPRVRLADGVVLPGGHTAIQNSYIGPIDYWRPAIPLNNPCAVGTGTVTVAQQTWKANNSDVGFVMPGTATYSIANSGGYNGGIWIALQSSGLLEAHYLSASGGGGPVSVSCSGPACGTLIAENTINTYGQHPSFWNPATVPACSASAANSGTSNVTNFVDSVWDTEGSHALYINDGPGPLFVSNNYFEGYGIDFFTDIGGPFASPNDALFLRNLFRWNQNHRNGSSTWNGYNYRVRNLFETKHARRWLIQGNELTGEWANVNAGDSLLLSGRFTSAGCASTNSGAYSLEGISDIEIAYNYIHDGSSGIYVQGGNAGVPGASCGLYNVGDPPLTSRVYIHDNLLTGLNSTIYQYTPPSDLIGEFIRALNGPTDLTVAHNTVWNLTGEHPTQLFLNYVASEGLDVRDNIMHLSVGPNSGGGLIVDSSLAVPGFSYLPAIDTTNYATILATTVPRLGGTPSAKFRNNVIIGGQNGDGSIMTQAQLNTYSSPNGAFYNSLAPANFFPAGNTQSAREAQVGVRSLLYGQYGLAQSSPYMSGAKNSTDGFPAGANVDRLADQQGQITNVRELSLASNVATIAFHAPDPGAACYVEFGTSPTGGNWTQSAADTTNSQERQVVLTGLSRETTYYYLVACAGTFATASRPFHMP